MAGATISSNNSGSGVQYTTSGAPNSAPVTNKKPTDPNKVANWVLEPGSQLPSYVHDTVAGVRNLFNKLHNIAEKHVPKGQEGSAGGVPGKGQDGSAGGVPGGQLGDQSGSGSVSGDQSSSGGGVITTHMLEAEFLENAAQFQQQLTDHLSAAGTEIEKGQLKLLQSGVTDLVQDAKNAFSALNEQATSQENSALAQGICGIIGGLGTGAAAGYFGLFKSTPVVDANNSFLKMNTISQGLSMTSQGVGSVGSAFLQADATREGAQAGKDSAYAQTAQEVLSSLLGVMDKLLQTTQALVSSANQAAGTEVNAGITAY